MPSVAETLHWLRDQRDRLKMEAEEKRSLKVLGHELDKLRQEIRDLGGEPCCLLEDYPVAREPKNIEWIVTGRAELVGATCIVHAPTREEAMQAANAGHEIGEMEYECASVASFKASRAEPNTDE